ncbi:MAG: YjjG family noncanonical pyrimidine nucleotidase [Flavobacteriaceae bacterium]
MIPNTITDIFFDLDHTLWDFERNSAATFQHLLEKHELGLSLHDFLAVYVPINRAYWKAYRNAEVTKEQLRYGRLKDAFDKLGHPVNDTIIRDLAEGYITHLTSFSHVFDHTHSTLEYLSTKYRLHILTNGFKEIQHKKLSGAQIDQFFSCVINAEEVGVKKPDPEIFNAALKRAEVLPEQALMIGDDLEADVYGALNAGWSALHFNNDDLASDPNCVSFSCLSELKQLL